MLIHLLINKFCLFRSGSLCPSATLFIFFFEFENIFFSCICLLVYMYSIYMQAPLEAKKGYRVP